MEIIVDESLVKQRIDKVIADKFPLYSRAALSKLLISGHVLLNGEPSRAGVKLRQDDVVTVDLSPLEALPEAIELPILYEDADVIVVNKPSGVISHARGKFVSEPSVASFVRQYVADITGDRAGIVHRLDRATSGVMICAKNQATLSWLQQQFADRKVKKTYQAIIKGEMPTKTGKIEMPIGRNPKKPQTFHVDAGGKPAVTIYDSVKSNDTYTLLELRPLTGRTHQLRVHLKELNHPIVGDTYYDGDTAVRLMLHAGRLEITMPSKKVMIFTSPTPKELSQYVETL